MLLLLGAAVVLAIPVCVVILLIGQSNLKARVATLELALQGLGAASQPGPPLEEVAAVAEAPPAPRAEMAQAGPWAAPPPQESAPAPLPMQDQPLVLRAERFAALLAWLSGHWVYVVSAASLALAGVFFVQYGAERGLLPPGLRVLAAILFGGALIGAGDWLRRRRAADGATAFLPAVFAGAGVVSIFAGLIAARQLYGMIGPETAFAGLIATALLAVVLGWINGPLLAAVGLIGAAAAPFLVAGGSGPEAWLYGHYAAVALIGLGVDALRRWAWVSVLALVLGFGGGGLMLLGGAGAAGFAAMLTGLALMAVAVPVLRLVPEHPGPMVAGALLARGAGGWPVFPVRLAAGAAAAASLGLGLMGTRSAGEGMVVFAAITVLALALLLWAERAEGLADLAVLPAAVFLLRLVLEAAGDQPLFAAFAARAIGLGPLEAAAPVTLSLLIGMAALISAAAAWRALRPGAMAVAFGLGAVLVAPVAAALAELFWAPGAVLGRYPWALHVMALAAGAVGLAALFARRDGEDRRRAAHATLSALSLIALALFLLAEASALTLALAVLVLVAAALDRRFGLPEMGLFGQAGVAVLGYRLLADPGIFWALSAPLGQVILSFGGVIAALLAALWLLRPMGRRLTSGVLESAAAGFGAIFVNVLVTRWLVPEGGAGGLDSHYAMTLTALPWLVLMLMQLYRAQIGGALRRLRLGIAVLAGGLAAGGLAVAVFPLNPLLAWGPEDRSGLVRGPWLLDSLALAYLVPGLLLAAAAWRMPGLARVLRAGFGGVGAGLILLYAGLEIRHIWRGAWLGGGAVGQGELYTYTVALMALGGGLLYQAIATQSVRLRRVAMAVIGLTAAKVFLIDASGLTGLTRVFSFLALGLSLAGLAWLNRWAGQASRK